MRLIVALLVTGLLFVPDPLLAADWHHVATFKGPAHIKNTESFRIPDREWRLSWKANGKGSFQVFVKDNSTDSTKDVAVNVIGPANDTSLLRGAGEYYLKILSSQDYEIRVETKH